VSIWTDDTSPPSQTGTSGRYYWMVLPPLTLVLAPLYLVRRQQHVGVP